MLARFFLGSLLAITCACTNSEIVPAPFFPKNDHHAYSYALEKANLLSTALGGDWIAAAKQPFKQQIEVQLPYQEAFLLSAMRPAALGYRFDVTRGQKILVDVSLITQDTTKVFIDLFRIEGDSLERFLHVASADSTLKLGFEPRKSASYLLRLQPELLRGGDFSISIEKVPTLDFPVAGKDKSAIQSFFGDARDGGRREHHGVDIFAKRHTPIIAPIEGQIRFAGTRGIGGKVVWLYDQKSGNHLYFAHLQDHKVNRFQFVNRGDTIGTVGNTGNARTTPPHLHFGIYNDGPINPFRFIVPEYTRPVPFHPDTTLLGANLKTTKQAFLYSAMHKQSPHLDTLLEGTTFKVLAINHNYIRIKNDHGSYGFLTKQILNESLLN